MFVLLTIGCSTAAPPEPQPAPSSAPVPQPRTDEDEPGEVPFTIDPGGFSQVGSSAGFLRWSSPPGGNCMVGLHWWRPYPVRPGRPMVVASESEVTVLGKPAKLLHTSQFDGMEKVVDVVMLPGDGFHARLTFSDCNRAEIEGFLNGLSP